jgi:hypothetical protein
MCGSYIVNGEASRSAQFKTACCLNPTYTRRGDKYSSIHDNNNRRPNHDAPTVLPIVI